MSCLDAIANCASILTAFVTATAAVCYWQDKRSKQKRLEGYLKAEMKNNPTKSTHTVIHLMAELGLTEAEILHASFASQHIVHKTQKDKETGLATQLLFEYSTVRKSR